MIPTAWREEEEVERGRGEVEWKGRKDKKGREEGGEREGGER